MKKSLVGLLLAIIFLIGVCSCYTGRRQSTLNRQNMLKLKIGMSREEVLLTMGQPYKTESYTKNGDTEAFWFYFTENCTDADRCFTPLLLVNDKLNGWGRNFYKYDDTIKIKQDIKKGVKIKSE